VVRKCNFRRDSTRIAILPGENEDLMSEWLEGRYSLKKDDADLDVEAGHRFWVRDLFG
jgi:hypothetical protein